MTLVVTPNEDDIFRGLRAFLQDVLPRISDAAPFVVVTGQDNRVPEPSEDNYIVMWPVRLPRLSTTVEKQIVGGLQATFEQSSQCVIQIDVHGSESFNNATIVSTLFRSSYGVEFFEARGTTIAPLFADDPRQMPFTSGEQQYEDRYIVEVNLQVNQTITAVAQSATSLTVEIVDVETPATTWPNSIVTAP